MTRIRSKDINTDFGWGEDGAINMEEVSSDGCSARTRRKRLRS